MRLHLCQPLRQERFRYGPHTRHNLQHSTQHDTTHTTHSTVYLIFFLFLFFSFAGEDALANLSIERQPETGKIEGSIRIRSKKQGIALSLGDKITSSQRTNKTKEEVKAWLK